MHNQPPPHPPPPQPPNHPPHPPPTLPLPSVLFNRTWHVNEELAACCCSTVSPAAPVALSSRCRYHMSHTRKKKNFRITDTHYKINSDEWNWHSTFLTEKVICCFVRHYSSLRLTTDKVRVCSASKNLQKFCRKFKLFCYFDHKMTLLTRF